MFTVSRVCDMRINIYKEATYLQVAIESVQESGISWEQYRKSVYGFLDEQNDEDEMRAEHEETKWPKFFDGLKVFT